MSDMPKINPDNESEDTDEGILYQEIVIQRRLFDVDTDDERDVIGVRISDTVDTLGAYGLLTFAEHMVPDIIRRREEEESDSEEDGV